jgi:GT2 family glycosyltransferase
MKVCIVIPNWNGADIIADCLRSLEAQTHSADIFVVDNGSVDDSVKLIEKKFPKVRLIKLPKNTGFDGGVNAGIRPALQEGYDAIAIFNNDAVADKQWLKHLVKALEADKKRGIVSCKQLYTDGKHIDSTGDFYSVWGMPFPRGRNQADSGQYDEPEELFSAPAAATLYRAKLFREIGMFDEKFFAYFEDVDISFRAQLAGWKIWYQPEAVVYHQVNATSSKLGSFSRYHSTKNFFMVYVKNMPGRLFWKYLPLFLVQAGGMCVFSFIRGGVGAYLKGVATAVWYAPRVLFDRFRIQRRRKVSISYIDSVLYHQRPPKIPPLH